MKLDTLEAMVREILKTNMKARDDDRELTLQVWVQFFGVNPWSPINKTLRDSHLPSQDSIGRCRRKLQQTDERFRGSKRKEAIRMDAQIDFIEYASK